MIVDIVYGFLGAGKTTFITRLLREWGSEQKIAVLVNEFGDVGIDGDLLRGQGGDVVEMPSGCICCTLKADFRGQILEISRTLKPERVVIEPTGVATISQIRSIIEAQLFEDIVEKAHDILVVDVTGFMGLYKANRHFVESQVQNAHLVVLNKCDRVDSAKASLIRNAISAIHPETSVLMAEFGAVEWDEYRAVLSTAPLAKRGVGVGSADTGSAVRFEEDGSGPFQGLELREQEDSLGLESVGYVFDDLTFDEEKLADFYDRLKRADSGLGEVVRAKGVFRVGDRAVLWELASGEVSAQPVGPSPTTKVSIIGRDLSRTGIAEELDRCVSGGVS